MKGYAIGMLAAVSILGVACTKKAEPPEPTREVTAPDTSMIDAAKEQAAEQVQAAKEEASRKMAAMQEQASQQMAAVKEQATQEVAAAKQAAEQKVAEYKEILVSATRPLTEVKAEAANLNVTQLKETALKYKDAITAKSGELQPLLEKLKALPLSQKLSGEGLQIKDQINQIKGSVTALKDRYDVYANRLKEMGVDVSAFLKK